MSNAPKGHYVFWFWEFWNSAQHSRLIQPQAPQGLLSPHGSSRLSGSLKSKIPKFPPLRKMVKKTKDPIVLSKEFPTNYPSDAVEILDAMSFGKGLNIVGSMSIRSQQYAGDYDGYEVVELKMKSDDDALSHLKQRFQANIKKLKSLKNVWIGDIKAGSVEEWRVIPKSAVVIDGKITGYNSTACKARVDELLKTKIISAAEAKDAKELLKNSPSISEFLLAKQKIKFHIVRWTPPEVLRNAKVLRDKRTMTLEQAFSSPTISKMDVIGLVQRNRFTDFSVIYEFRNNGKTLNPDKIDIGQSLKEAILAYSAEGNWFKVLKRRYALAKFTNDLDTVKKLTPFLNSDLGRLYHIVGDIGTLTNLLDGYANVPMDIVRYEIDQFKNRLSNIYSLKDYLKHEGEVFGMIKRIVSLPKDKMIEPLSKLEDMLTKYLQNNTKAIMDGELKGALPSLKGAGYKDIITLLGLLGTERTQSRLDEINRERYEVGEALEAAVSPVEKARLRRRLRELEDASIDLRRRSADPYSPYNEKIMRRRAMEKYVPEVSGRTFDSGMEDDPIEHLGDIEKPKGRRGLRAFMAKDRTPKLSQFSPAMRRAEYATDVRYRQSKAEPESAAKRRAFHTALAGEMAERLRSGEF